MCERTLEDKREEYDEQRCEAQMMGDMDFPSFEEWLNPSLRRQRAEERINAIWERGEQDMW